MVLQRHSHRDILLQVLFALDTKDFRVDGADVITNTSGSTIR